MVRHAPYGDSTIMRGNPILSATQIAHIRRLHKSGLSIHELKNRYSVSRDVIDNIVSNHLEYQPVKFQSKGGSTQP